MGLLSFKKSTKKQARSSKEPQQIVLPPALDQSPAIPKPSESSLLEDIMKELSDSSPITPHTTSPVGQKSFSPLLQFNAPPVVPTATNSVPLLKPLAATQPDSRVVPPRPLVSLTGGQQLHSSDDSESEAEEEMSDQRHSVPVANKQWMSRMKERHRQEVRKTVSPLAQEGLSSSPSMPIMLSEKSRPIVQSQSFTTYNNQRQRPQSQLIRPNSTANPLMTQAPTDIGFFPRHPPLASSPSFMRTTFPQLTTRTISTTTEEEEVHGVQINRSASAYTSFPVQNQQELKRWQDEIKNQRQQELQMQQEIQRQQQQIIVQQQQQLQQLQHQQQLLIQQQQYQQQQQQQQLLLQQQQIQKLQQQSSLEVKVTKSKTVRPLYERNTGVRLKKKQVNEEDGCCSKPYVSCTHNQSPLPSPIKMSQRSARSSTTTLIAKEEEKKNLPVKLKRELENMQMVRSVYSVPDLSGLSRESDGRDGYWDQVELPKRTKKITEPMYLYYVNDCHPHPKEHACHKKKHHCSSSKYILVE